MSCFFSDELRRCEGDANVKWHAFPAPGIDFRLQRGEGFGPGIVRYAVFIAIAEELTANQAVVSAASSEAQSKSVILTRPLMPGPATSQDATSIDVCTSARKTSTVSFKRA